MLLGNKLDFVEENKEKRVILAEEAEKICSEKNIYWGGEFSAKTFSESQLKEISKYSNNFIFFKIFKKNQK